MNHKKILVTTASVVVLGGSLIFGVSQAHAQTSTAPFSKLAQMISQKFNLDQNQVQSVIDQYKTEQQQTRLQKIQETIQTKLDKLVANKKITSDQKQAILTEIDQLKAKYLGNFSSLTHQQKQQQIQLAVNEFKTWAKSQNIDLSSVNLNFGRAKMLVFYPNK